MWNKSPLLLFVLLLVLTLTLSYGIHYFILDYLNIESSNQDLTLPYGVNLILTAIITTLLYLLRKKQAENLGFIFMGSSFFKFLIFFLVFQPIYKADGEISTMEFWFFFAPYAISLASETFFLVQIMNKQD